MRHYNKTTMREFAFKHKRKKGEEVRTYQLCRVIEIMVAHVHSILDHLQVGMFVQIIGEGVEVAHVSDRSILVVEGALAIDDRLGGIGTRDRHARQRLLPLHWDDG